MDSTTELLSSSFKLPCGQAVRNRLVKAAMTEGLASPDGMANERHVNLYRAWASGGCGLLITGNVMVKGDHLERPGNVIIDGQQSAAALQRLTAWSAAAKENNTRVWMQISHSGRQCQARVNKHPKSASDVQLALPGGQFARPTPLNEEEIGGLIQAFVSTAMTAAETGFDGVQIHAAHGYLISQFLSPKSNRRKDEWGGSLKNRARFLRQVVSGIKQNAPAGFAVSVKLNSSDFQKGGFGADDARQVSRWLAEDGVDLIEISGGTYEQPKMLELEGIEESEEIKVKESTRQREAFFQQFAAELRSDIQCPLMVTGGFRDTKGMAEAISEDGIALIGLGRPLCGAPNSPNEILSGAPELPRFERRFTQRTGFFSSHSPLMLIRLIAGFSVMAWYYHQILMMADKHPLELDKNIFKAFLELQSRESKWVRAWKKRR